MTIVVNIGSIDFRKRVYIYYIGKNLQCQLANEDDLQSKTVIQEFVLRIVFNIEMG